MPFTQDNPYQELQPLPDGDHWRTTTRLTYKHKAQGTVIRVRVPAGFVTDGASIPRLLWSLVGHPLGEYHPAAIVHDALYDGTAPLPNLDNPRRVADQILLAACADLGVSWVKRRTLYIGVRVGGWLPWRRYRERKDAKRRATP